MSGYQRIIVCGRLGHPPSIKSLSSGDAVAEFSIAVSGYKDEVEWFKAKAFKKNAENIGKFFEKGDVILVEGKMQTSSWEGKDGTKKSKTELIVDRWAFCGEKKVRPQDDASGEMDDDKDVPF